MASSLKGGMVSIGLGNACTGPENAVIGIKRPRSGTTEATLRYQKGGAMDPRLSPPSGSADDITAGGSAQAVMTTHPQEATSTGTFAIQLFNPDSPTPDRPIGWVGRNSSGWAVLATDADRLNLEAYINGGTTYYKVAGESRYMSVSNRDYIGFYSWSGASAFHRDGDYLVSDYNNQRLSFYSPENGYLYCYDKYTQLKVAFVPI